MIDICKYTRESEIEQYSMSCASNEYDCVHPQDCEDWIYCPYCSNVIVKSTGGEEDE